MSGTNAIAAMLAGGKRRDLGRTGEAVAAIQADPDLMTSLLEALLQGDVVVRARAASVLRRLVDADPQMAEPYRRQLLGPVLAIDQWEVRNELCHILPALAPNAEEMPAIVAWLERCGADKSGIVRTWSLNALYELSKINEGLAETVSHRLARVLASGTPAERARARHILADLEAH